MPKEIADKYREDLTRSEKAQVVAPYGSGIKEVAPKPRQRLAPIEGEAIYQSSINRAWLQSL